jgi:hypothetical protein
VTAAKRNLARKLNRPSADVRAAPSSPWVVGTVAAVSLSTNSLTVTMQGDTTAVPGVSFLDSYMPVVNDTVILVRIKQHLWVVGSVAGSYAPIVGSSTNIISGGSNRTNTTPYLYSQSFVGNTTGGGIWSQTITNASFVGVGNFMVCPGDSVGPVAMMVTTQSRCSISSGLLTLGGTCYQASGSTTPAATVRFNIQVTGW